MDRDHAQLAPLLVDVAPDGTTKTVSRGFLNLQYRNGLAAAEPIPPIKQIQATVTFKPQDQLFEAGHRIGVIVQGSNTVWALPDDPGATYPVTPQRWRSRSRSSTRRIFPVSVFGRSSTNSISRGYAYADWRSRTCA